jgi:hypothetical protein
MSEESTAEVMIALANDVDRCYASLMAALDTGKEKPDGNLDADYEFHARQLYRAAFAFIEAVTFSAKARAAAHCIIYGVPISDAERFLATDTDYIVTNTGAVKERPARIRLAENVRFAVALTERAKGIKKFELLLMIGGHAYWQRSRSVTG